MSFDLEKDGLCIIPIKPIYTTDEVNLIWKSIDQFESKVYTIDKYRRDLWNINHPLFDKTSQRFKDIDEIVGKIIKDKNIVRKSIGLLPLLPGGEPGVWHRDIIELFDGMDTLKLPNFYYTVFIPIDGINQATQFVLGSHISRDIAINPIPIKHSPNEMIIMNGKLIHRGGVQQDKRLLMYIIYCKTWYDEERFVEF